ncbi:MAG: TlpA disulfide reductase family protein [Actinomycetota bacterium]
MTDTNDASDIGQPSEVDAGDMRLSAGRRWLMLGLGTFIVLAGVLFVALGGESDGSTGGGHLDIAFTLPDGDEIVLADFEGEAMVVNFFASWCGPCRAEMPDFEEVHQSIGDQVRFIGLSTDARQSDAEEIVADTGITYLWGRDANADIFAAYEGAVMPTTVFVTAEGEIVDVHGGILTAEALTERALELLG